MEAEIGFFEWGFKAIVGVLLAIGGYLWSSLVGNVRSLEREQANFKLEVANHYVRESSIARFHDRLDDIERDIKTLIKAVAEK